MNKKIIVLLSLILTFLFYWFQIRPAQIRNYCDQVAWRDGKSRSAGTDFYDWKYTQCLHNKGLK